MFLFCRSPVPPVHGTLFFCYFMRVVLISWMLCSWMGHSVSHVPFARSLCLAYLHGCLFLYIPLLSFRHFIHLVFKFQASVFWENGAWMCYILRGFRVQLRVGRIFHHFAPSGCQVLYIASLSRFVHNIRHFVHSV